MSSRSDVRIGSQRPTFQSLPADRRGSAGQEAVELAALAGLELDDWQAWLLEEMLQVGSDARWSAFEVGLVVPRQNGKGGLLEARQLFGLFLGGERLAVHTAHEFKTCYEHFLRIVSLVENTPELMSKVDRIRTGAGDQAIELLNGQRLRFIARSAGSGRGLSGDTVYLDEAFALTPEIMGALLPTLSAVPNPQVVYTSSHPKWSQRVLYELVQRGRVGSDRLLYAEWGNDDIVANDDRAAWARANPALGIRIDERVIEAELAAMAAFPDEFRRERLGIVTDETHISVVPADRWRAACSPDAAPSDPLTFAVEVSPDRDWAAIVAAGKNADGGTVVELIDYRAGVGWLPDRCAQLVADHRARLVLEARSPAAAVAGIDATEIATGDAVKAAGAFYDGIAGGRLTVRSDPRFDTALAAAARQPVGDAWRFGRKAGGDVCPLNAAVLAAWGASTTKEFEFFVY